MYMDPGFYLSESSKHYCFR